MDTLKDLKEIYESANGRFSKYEGHDFVLPEAFKSKVSDINSYHISYNQYSAVVNSNDGLSIYLPNQWFYVASYFTEFYNELIRYKSYAVQAVSKERLKDLNGSTLTETEQSRINSLNIDYDSKERLKKFITKYSWWHGGKTIDRGDFYVSPILNGARLVNQSQSYVADLCAFLADKPELVKIIIDGEESGEVSVSVKVIENKRLSTFILSVISYLEKNESLSPIAVYARDVEKGTPIKVSKPDLFNLVGMFIETSLDDLKNRNSPQIRWFDKEFKLDDRYVYLSTQWVATDNYQLTFKDFVKLIDFCYKGKYSCKVNSEGGYELLVVKRDELKEPRQQIFYGAPGTGKSHKVKSDEKVKIADEKNLVFRTTFHPDSDYSTFVGAYKPTMRAVADKYKAVAGKDEEITYEFIPQTFLQAYIAAWNNPEENVFLIIEEINRGNCAQIFGDLFQLLDRDDNGFSEYPIKADRDLARYLSGKDEFDNEVLINKDGIKDGKLKLPNNLYIWATMNTSDQSLFPIDSAFKRRWDWQYVPIHDCKKGYRIAADTNEYDWWSFLEKINGVIGELTSSEDKKLGYFFCKADAEGVISAEKFVSKVIFYLWNDVFKDFDVNSDIIKDGDSKLTFNSFYSVINDKNIIRKDKVELFLNNLKVDVAQEIEIAEDDENNEFVLNDGGRDKSRYSINGTGKFKKGELVRNVAQMYVDNNPDMTAEEVIDVWSNIGVDERHFVESEEEYNERVSNSSDGNSRAFPIKWGDNIMYITSQWGIGNIGKFIRKVNEQDWNIKIEQVPE